MVEMRKLSLVYLCAVLGLARVADSNCLLNSVQNLTAHETSSLLSMMHSDFNAGTCQWAIQADGEEKVVVLEVVKWSFKSCNPNISVYDGANKNSKMSWWWCSDTAGAPYILRSSGRHVLVEMSVSGGSFETDHGFDIQYHSRNKYEFKKQHLQAVAKPSFMYIPSQASFSKKFGVPRWRLEFKQKEIFGNAMCVSVELVSSDHTFNVLKPYTQLYDGPNVSSAEMGKCGNVDKWPITSSQKYMVVIIKPINDTSIKGFWLKYSSTESCTSDVIHLTADVTPKDLSPKTAISPTCRWKIKTEKRVRLEIVNLGLKNSGSGQGYLAAYDYGLFEKKVIGKWTTNAPSSIVTQDSSMFLEYRSGDVPTTDGPRFKYSVYTGACSKRLFAADTLPDALPITQYYSTVNYPGNYPNSWLCKVLIRAQREYQKIRLEFLDFEVDCRDSVIIKEDNGSDENEKTIAKLCGSGSNTMIYDVTGTTSVELNADGEKTARGFRLSYRAFKPLQPTHCETTLIADEERSYLTSPAYPSNYSGSFDCVWILKAWTPQHSVVVKFLRSDFEHMDCQNDSVTVGSDISAPSLGSRCSQSRPFYRSSGQYLRINFRTSRNTSNSGFKLRYYSASKSYHCEWGRVMELTASLDANQSLFSPNYPGEYIDNVDCTWRILSGDPNCIIKLDVQESDVQFSDDCHLDVARVYDGFNENSALLGYWCGNSTPSFASSGQFLYIVFTTDPYISTRGFKLAYRAVRYPSTTGIPPTTEINTTPEIATTASEVHASTRQDTTSGIATETRINTETKTDCAPQIITVPAKSDPVVCEKKCSSQMSQTGETKTALIVVGSVGGLAVLALFVTSVVLVARGRNSRQSYRISNQQGANVATSADRAQANTYIPKQLSGLQRDLDDKSIVALTGRLNPSYDDPFPSTDERKRFHENSENETAQTCGTCLDSEHSGSCVVADYVNTRPESPYNSLEMQSVEEGDVAMEIEHVYVGMVHTKM